MLEHRRKTGLRFDAPFVSPTDQFPYGGPDDGDAKPDPNAANNDAIRPVDGNNSDDEEDDRRDPSDVVR